MSDSKKILTQARRLLENKRYTDAHKLLKRLPDNPTAQKWLAQLESRMAKAQKNTRKRRRFPLMRLIMLLTVLIAALAAAVILSNREDDSQPERVHSSAPTFDPNATPIGFVGDGAQSFDYAAYGIVFVPPSGWMVDTGLDLTLGAPTPPLLCSASPCTYLAVPESTDGVLVDTGAIPADEVAVQLLFAPEINTLQTAQQRLMQVVRDETAQAIANDEDYTMSGSEMRPQGAGSGLVQATIERDSGDYTITILLADPESGMLALIYGDYEAHQSDINALLASVRRT
jgi:hypothetical protein